MRILKRLVSYCRLRKKSWRVSKKRRDWSRKLMMINYSYKKDYSRFYSQSNIYRRMTKQKFNLRTRQKERVLLLRLMILFMKKKLSTRILIVFILNQVDSLKMSHLYKKNKILKSLFFRKLRREMIST